MTNTDRVADDTPIIEGMPAARDGDRTASGSRIAAQSSDVTIQGNGFLTPPRTRTITFLSLISMPSPPHANSAFRTASRRAAIAATVTILNWCIVIAWWQSTQRVVATADVVLYLIALPFSVLLCLVAVRRIGKPNEQLQHLPPTSASDTTPAEREPDPT